jgi:hypothetical protein
MYRFTAATGCPVLHVRLAPVQLKLAIATVDTPLLVTLRIIRTNVVKSQTRKRSFQLSCFPMMCGALALPSRFEATTSGPKNFRRPILGFSQSGCLSPQESAGGRFDSRSPARFYRISYPRTETRIDIQSLSCDGKRTETAGRQNGFYQDHIASHLVNLAMHSRELARCRDRIVGWAHVLERTCPHTRTARPRFSVARTASKTTGHRGSARFQRSSSKGRNQFPSTTAASKR